MENRDFSQNLATLRKTKGLTQKQLAERSQISQRMIAYYETDPSANPPIETITALAKALNVTFDELFGEYEPSEVQNELSKIDSRTLGKLKKILSLPKSERHIIYNMAEAFIAKRKLQDIEENIGEK